MKKIFLLIVFSICVLNNTSIFANNEKSLLFETQNFQKEYKKIKVSDIPQEVVSKISKDYGNYVISEASKADDGEYKLVLTKDNVPITVTFTSTGEMIKIL